MASLNKVILMGNLTRDVQVRYTSSGKAVTDLSLAMNRKWFDRETNERREDVTYVDVKVWGRTAEVAGEYLSKGSPVMVEGRLQLDKWIDKATGKKRSKLHVVCENMTMLPSGEPRKPVTAPNMPEIGETLMRPHGVPAEASC